MGKLSTSRGDACTRYTQVTTKTQVVLYQHAPPRHSIATHNLYNVHLHVHVHVYMYMYVGMSQRSMLKCGNVSEEHTDKVPPVFCSYSDMYMYMSHNKD